MSVRCSRAALASFPASSASSSAVHRPSFGRGWTSRSYANDVAPDRTTLRTVFRDTRRSRAISLIALPLRKYSRRIRPIVSTVSIPHYPRLIRRGQRITPHGRGGNFGRRYPRSGGQDGTPKHILHESDIVAEADRCPACRVYACLGHHARDHEMPHPSGLKLRPQRRLAERIRG